MPVEIPTTEIIQRVFAITPDQSGCGSSLGYATNQAFYLITAAHVLGGMEHAKKSSLYIFKNDEWLRVEATPFYVAKRPYQEGDIDIAVVKTQLKSSPSNLTLSLGGAMMGQDAHFLGFPYFGGSINHKGTEFNENFPIPFVKKAVISAIHNPIIFLDGHNNPGFSGGPVVFYDYQEKKKKIAGVVSAYLTQTGEINKIETATRDFYRENSGIGIAYNIEYANKLIKEIDAY
jgi:hypothetical protein